VKKGNWTAEEDDMIFKGYLQFGSSWSRIAKNLEGMVFLLKSKKVVAI
jgi:hypothetical protein